VSLGRQVGDCGAGCPRHAEASLWVSGLSVVGRPANGLSLGSADSCFCPSLGVPRLAFVRLTLPPPKVVDRWNEKRALFGVYDNIGILGRTRFLVSEGLVCSLDSFGFICGENSNVPGASLGAQTCYTGDEARQDQSEMRRIVRSAGLSLTNTVVGRSEGQSE
jgi:hypothetical protein